MLDVVDDKNCFQCNQCKCCTHSDCIAEWWKNGIGCPMCRYCDFEQFVTTISPDTKVSTTSAYMTLFQCLVAIAQIGDSSTARGGNILATTND